MNILKTLLFGALVLSCIGCQPSETVHTKIAQADKDEKAASEKTELTSNKVNVQTEETPSGHEIFESLGRYYKSQDRISMKLSVGMPSMGGMGSGPKQTLSIATAKPDRIAIDASAMGMQVFAVDDRATIAIGQMGSYMEKTHSGPMHQLLEMQPKGIMPNGMLSPALSVAMIITSPDPVAAVNDRFDEIKLVAKESVEERDAWHLALIGKEFDAHVWIAASGDPVILRSESDMAKGMRNMGGAPSGTQMPKVVFSVDYQDWQFGEDVQDADLTFDSSGFKKTDDLFRRQPSPAENLIGKQAPVFTAEDLDGGSVQVGKPTGKVQLIDFWATWCGPCVQELPIIIELMDKYADRDVQLLAVNVNEDSETIRKFQDEKDLVFTTVRDVEEEGTKAYFAGGIPQLVIIDQKGIVRHVHVGA